MNFGELPPKRTSVPGKSSYNKKHKGRLRPEDVEENNPELAQFLRERRAAETRMDDAAEIDFSLVLVFQSEAQKNEFLDNMPEEIATFYDTFVDGERLAQLCNIPVTPCTQKEIKSPLHKRLVANTGIPKRPPLPPSMGMG